MFLQKGPVELSCLEGGPRSLSSSRRPSLAIAPKVLVPRGKTVTMVIMLLLCMLTMRTSCYLDCCVDGEDDIDFTPSHV